MDILELLAQQGEDHCNAAINDTKPLSFPVFFKNFALLSWEEEEEEEEEGEQGEKAEGSARLSPTPGGGERPSPK